MPWEEQASVLWGRGMAVLVAESHHPPFSLTAVPCWWLWGPPRCLPRSSGRPLGLLQPPCCSGVPMASGSSQLLIPMLGMPPPPPALKCFLSYSEAGRVEFPYDLGETPETQNTAAAFLHPVRSHGQGGCPCSSMVTPTTCWTCTFRVPLSAFVAWPACLFHAHVPASRTLYSTELPAGPWHRHGCSLCSMALMGHLSPAQPWDVWGALTATSSWLIPWGPWKCVLRAGPSSCAERKREGGRSCGVWRGPCQARVQLQSEELGLQLGGHGSPQSRHSVLGPWQGGGTTREGRPMRGGGRVFTRREMGGVQGQGQREGMPSAMQGRNLTGDIHALCQPV